ncbi:MAG: hypothetical protein HBSIN02_11270 [Bacteroidia bacterium]|nr:MAG: hypothetical protein HBSIN02_11270 [Bacteroidia bacterium]
MEIALTIEDQFQSLFNEYNKMKHNHASLTLASIERLHGTELARISHALKTPLTSIIGFTSAILDDATIDRKTCAEFVRIIKTESERLSRFVEELLYVSFANPDTPPALKQRTSPSTVMRTAVRLAATTLNQPQSRFILKEMDHVETPVELDREFVTKMLVNVFSNAARFSPGIGSISITGHLQENFFVCRVASRRRGRNLDIRTTPGNLSATDIEALGLARTRHMLALRGGSLTIVPAPGPETTVEVCLPVSLTATNE